MGSEIQRNLRLILEFERAVKLIKEGFRQLEQIDEGNDFYELVFFCFSNGFERLFKVVLVKYYSLRHNQYPSPNELWGNGARGHDLFNLKRDIEAYFKDLDDQRFKHDLNYLKDKKLNDLLMVFSKYAVKGRFSDMDIVLGNDNVYDPKEEWGKIETALWLKNGKQDNFEGIIRHVQFILRTYLTIFFRQLHFGDFGKEFQLYWNLYEEYFTVEPIQIRE